MDWTLTRNLKIQTSRAEVAKLIKLQSVYVHRYLQYSPAKWRGSQGQNNSQPPNPWTTLFNGQNPARDSNNKSHNCHIKQTDKPENRHWAEIVVSKKYRKHPSTTQTLLKMPNIKPPHETKGVQGMGNEVFSFSSEPPQAAHTLEASAFSFPQ